MALKAEEIEAALIDSVCSRVRERLSGEEGPACEAFVRQYYHWVPREDLVDRSPLDLYGAALAHWNFAHQRGPGAAKLRLYNPLFEQHGWQSTHTALEIVTDDMPFLVDSVVMELNRHGYGIHRLIHPVVWVHRDADGNLVGVEPPGSAGDGARPESVMHVEVDRETEPDRLAALTEHLHRALDEVRAVVEDLPDMRGRVREIITELAETPPLIDPDEVAEARAFLEWCDAEHFAFLGYREYDLAAEDGEDGLHAVAGSGRGILRQTGPASFSQSFARVRPSIRALARGPQLLILTKANSRSTVHRPVYLDYIGVKRFGPSGEVTGERRFLGMYTTAAYRASPREIPILRGKVDRIQARAAFPPEGHDAKALEEIVETYPRDELFQVADDELFDLAMGILGLGERHRVRLFVRRDIYDRFLSCLVYIPRDRFNTENRQRIGKVLEEEFGASGVDWSLRLSESVLVRVHYVVHCGPGGCPEIDAAKVEARLAEVTRSWTDDLHDALIEEHGEEHGIDLFRRYETAFPAAYRADWVARSAVVDIRVAEKLAPGGQLVMSLYRPLEAKEGFVRCKLFSGGQPVSLSDVLPMFEHMGARVAEERPYEVTPRDGSPVWIYDFGLACDGDFAGDRVRQIFQDAFVDVWRGELEDDGLNGLVLKAGLTGREVTILRAVAKYLRQAGITFSGRYIEGALLAHPAIARSLVDLFRARFDPQRPDAEAGEQLARQTEQAIDSVPSLDEDRILRNFLAVLSAIVRTNYFQSGPDRQPKPHLSFKLDPSLVPLVPLPRPRFEIFVYSPRTEGAHLRGGKVARGGLRWSNRLEDFRTEVLGLMKAQMVKNALIIPVGAKGGFVVKRPPQTGGREALVEEVTECYRTFIRGLLDVTDNIVDGKVVAPPGVVRYDDDDPYLVVAADKGTATFSDTANAVAAEYDFWLGDAFASGGSSGYDHKKMGITARGAWESVKRHFLELGTDIQSSDLTVVGIGDMAGDVFGNGMLLSGHIRLLAAFNHEHIFLDPDPDPETSFAERRRLFELPRSSWLDYDQAVISEGGGVFPRTAKSIPLSGQVRASLGIEADALTPNELIRALLQAPVDLLWNGGIGTYVKAAAETHADADDKANDAVRVDGSELRCRVVGEGGNLGLTQRGRIEFALAGGLINTDAIDNAGGVNCSDHEVNIKILLNSIVAAGDMTEKQRNELLAGMTDIVAEQVLRDSYTQTQALSLARAQAASMLDVHARLLRSLEQAGKLNRGLERLPSDELIAERKLAERGLTSPELAALLAYCKITLYSALLDSDLPEDPYLSRDLARYFPAPLPDRFGEQMHHHRLRREIIATHVTNSMVDRAGITFAFRLAEETGAPVSHLARAYAVAREVFDMRRVWTDVEALDNVVPAQVQFTMLFEGRKLVERATRWLVRHRAAPIDIAAAVSSFAPGAVTLAQELPDTLDGHDREAWEGMFAELAAAGVPATLAARVASMTALFSALDVVEVADATGRPLDAVCAVYFRLASRLQLHWLRDRILEQPRADRWQTLARAALRDDIHGLQRALTSDVLRVASPTGEVEFAIDAWVERNADAVERCLEMLAEIKAARQYDLTTLPLALREVRNLIGTAAPSG